MRNTPEIDARVGLDKLATYPYQILTWVDDAGYPTSVAVEARIDPCAPVARFTRPAGLDVPADRALSLTGSHIRPQPGYGYDERRHVTVWGRAIATADAAGADAGAEGAEGMVAAAGTGNSADELTLTGEQAWGWDEAEVPFFEYSERSTGRSRAYFDALSRERGTPVKPSLSFGMLTLRTTRLPFLTATIVPVLLGILIAATQGAFDLVAALLTVVGASFVQLAINVSNDVFDTAQGADDANVTPTQFSGGSRVIQYGLVSFRQMATLATAFYLAGAAIGLVLLARHGSPALLVIGVVGFVVGLGYTAPPLKLVYRGFGEIAVAVGFGPLMLVGAYVVQTGGTLSWEPFVASIPIALLVALILYVNEIPDRRGDAHAGKRTLPVRFSREAVVMGYRVAVGAAYWAIVLGVVAGMLPIPALVALLTIPLARRVAAGLTPNYENPYDLMAVMGQNVKLHLQTGGLMVLAYVFVLIVGAVAPSVDLFLG